MSLINTGEYYVKAGSITLLESNTHLKQQPGMSKLKKIEFYLNSNHK